jgi:predicted Zn-dependent peptidase
MYGGTPFSKLFANVREKLSLCYYCQAAIVECKGAMLVDSGVEPGNEQKAEQEILNQLESLRAGDFTDEEIENTKKYLIGAYLSNYDSSEDLNSWYFFQFARGTNDSPKDAIEKINAATREDIINSANSFKLDTVYTLTPSGGENNA